MKLTQLSLATMMIGSFSIHAFAADTLADAFREGKLTGLHFIGKTHSDNISAYG